MRDLQPHDVGAEPDSLARHADAVRGDADPARAEHRLRLWLFVLAAAIFLLFQQGLVTGYDGTTMYEVTRSMVERGTFAISGEWNTLPGPDGLEYARYGLGLSLLGAVPYLLVRPLAAMSASEGFISSAAVASIMPLIAAGLIVALFALARRLGARAGPAVVVGVGAVVGTFMLPYSKESFSEPLAALCLVVAIERSLARRPNAAGLALGLAVLTRPQALLLVPFFLLVGWRRDGVRASLRTAAGLAPGVIATLAYNALRFGGPLRFGYQDVGFTTPITTGISGLFFEPTKSILLFAPVVVLVPFALADLWRRDRWASVLIGLNLVMAFLVTATWFSWHGGWCWGPRLLLPGILPAVAAIGPWASTRTRLRTTVGLLAVGFAVSLPGFLVSPEAQQLETSSPPPETHFLDTQPLASPSIVRQFELVPGAVRYSIERPYEDRGDGTNRLRTLSLWQLGTMRALGTSGLVASAIGSIALIAMAFVAGRRLRGAWRDLSQAETSGTVDDDTDAGPYEGTSNLEAMEAARNYNRFLDAVVLARVDPSRPVLDFGAGTGTHARRLRARGLDVRCVEPDPGLRARLLHDGFEAAQDVPALGPVRFASIYSLNVLEHIDDDEGALRQLFEATHPEGRLVVYVPAFQLLFSAMDRRVGHVRRYRRRALTDRVARAGFRVDACRYVDCLGFGAALAYRLLARSGSLNPRSVARYDRWIFPISRSLDRFTGRWFGKNLLLEARRD